MRLQNSPDWSKIKEDYIKNYPDITCEELGKRYGVPEGEIVFRVSHENWSLEVPEVRKQWFINQNVWEVQDYNCLIRLINDKLFKIDYETKEDDMGNIESKPVSRLNFDLTTKEILELVQARCLLQDFIHKTYKGEKTN